MIVVTGADGLIGRHLCARLESEAIDFKRFDLKRSADEDIRNPGAFAAALEGATGVVHLAAISRVAWGELNPTVCLSTNVRALAWLIDFCLKGTRPWLVFASSREVYGQPSKLPVQESDALQPVNVYGRSKRDGELLITSALETGLRANICRFSNVYGCADDHKVKRSDSTTLSAHSCGGLC